MAVKFNSKVELAKHFHFIVNSDKDALRLEKAWMLYTINYKGDGNYGCIAEMLTATTHSKKETISNTGKVDCFIKYRCGNGAVIPVSVERKTNGGRIKTIDTEFSKAESMNGKYIVYSMDICNSTTSYLNRHVDAVVIPKTLFINKLIEFNAIKAVRHNGIIDGYAIQVSNKSLYNWLRDYPIVYDRNAVYCDDDFDGLD